MRCDIRCALAASLLLFPRLAATQTPMRTDTLVQKPFSVGPGESRSPGTIKVKVSGADNGGAFAVLEALTAAGPPDPKAFAAIFKKHDMEIVGPPLPAPKK